MSRLIPAILGGLLAVLPGCDLAAPEVMVVHDADETLLIRNVSFNGCVWTGVLRAGESTVPARCLPGRDRVHFQRFDPVAYIADLNEPPDEDDLALTVDERPVWFRYQTVTEHDAAYGEFVRIRLTAADMEQDFSVPGPYGH